MSGRGAGSSGLVGLLVIIACVGPLFTRRYPPALFDFTLGLDRWVARGSRICRPHDRRLPAVPARHGAARTGAAERRARECRGSRLEPAPCRPALRYVDRNTATVPSGHGRRSLTE